MSAEPDPAGVDRRELLRRGAIAGGLATVGTFWIEGFGDPARRQQYEPTRPGAPARTFTQEGELATLAACVDRLLPSGGPQDPGASDVNAAGYIDRIASEPWFGANTLQRIRAGLAGLDRALRGRRVRFAAADLRTRDAVLKSFEGHEDGVAFIRILVLYTLEAFFGDPVHGVNPGEVAWKWARHTPGAPRPTEPFWKLEGR